jgi:hypothetical protein
MLTGAKMTDLQQYALSNPLARARGNPNVYRRIVQPWSIILTVNK